MQVESVIRGTGHEPGSMMYVRLFPSYGVTTTQSAPDGAQHIVDISVAALPQGDKCQVIMDLACPTAVACC